MLFPNGKGMCGAGTLSIFFLFSPIEYMENTEKIYKAKTTLYLISCPHEMFNLWLAGWESWCA